MQPELTISAVSKRTAVAPSALRYYEAEGLIHASRSPGGQRRYARATLRRVSFIRVAQQVGLSLDEIRDALASLPDNRTPNEKDWQRLSASWRPRIDAQIALLDGCATASTAALAAAASRCGFVSSSTPTTKPHSGVPDPTTSSTTTDRENAWGLPRPG